MSYDHARYNDLKAKILALMKTKGHTEPIEAGGYYLDQNGVWLFKTHAGKYQPVMKQDFDGLIDEHSLDYLSGTHDTFESHERTILEGMQEALTQLTTP